jgi:broad specificity phosphatase PhoE
LFSILDCPNQVIAIVTHGGPIRCIVREVLRRGELKALKNGTIIELEKHSSGLEIISLDGTALEQD